MLKPKQYVIGIGLVAVVSAAVFFSSEKLQVIENQQASIDLSNSAIDFENLEIAGHKIEIQPLRSIEKKPFEALSEKKKAELADYLNGAFKKLPLSENNQLIYNNKTKHFLTVVYNSLNQSHLQTFDEATLQAIQAAALSELPAEAGESMVTLLDNYVAYRDAEKAIMPADRSAQSLLQFHEQALQLRRVYLGMDIANDLFTEEEAFARYSIQTEVLKADNTLSESEKQQHAQRLQAAFVAEFSNSISTATMQNIKKKGEDLKQKGASEAEVFEFYVNAVGKEKAKEITQL